MNNLGGMPRVLVALAIVAIASSTVPVPAAAAGGPATEAPRIAFALNGQVNGTGVPLTVSWPKAAPAGAPLSRYELERSLDQGAWTPIKLNFRLTRSLTVRVKPWKHIQFRVRAVDTSNVAGDWAVSDPRWLAVAQENDAKVGFASGWQTVSDSKAYGKARAVTWTAGASATFSFIGRQVAWVAPVGPARGTATVNSSLGSAGVNLTRSTGSAQRIVYRAFWPDNATHAMTITSAVSNSAKAVDVDAFLVLSDPPDGQIVGAGDISRCDNDHDADTAALVSGVLDSNPQAVAFTAGDNTYVSANAAAYANCYDPTWGAFKSRTRPSPGNHEYYKVPGATAYFDYFGVNAGPAGNGWYSFEAGTWRIYSLNSEHAVDSTKFKSQLAWLKADLAANAHRCVLAIWHRPRWSTGEHGNSVRMAQFYQALYDAGADVVLTGHDHGYQRYTPLNPSGTPDVTRGMRQFVVGTGGGGLYAWETESTLLEVRDNTSHGVIRLGLQPGTYSWEFLPVPGPTGFTDSGTAACH